MWAGTSHGAPLLRWLALLIGLEIDELITDTSFSEDVPGIGGIFFELLAHFGAGRIAGYLQRFHQVAIAVSSVHRILGKHGMNRLW